MRFKLYITESINDKGVLKAVILGGLPAAGKSTIAQKIISDGYYPISVINTDKWTEFYGGDYKSNRSKIKRLTKVDFVNTVNSLLPIYIDSVSGDMQTFKRRIDELKRIGYDVQMIFADIDYLTSLKRVLNRNKNQPRKVDPSYVKDKFDTIYGGGSYTSIKDTPVFKQYSSIIGTKPIVVDAKDLSWNKLNKKVYNEVMRFLGSSVKNKRGKKLIDYMRKNGYKYYNEVPEEWLKNNGYPLLKEITYK